MNEHNGKKIIRWKLLSDQADMFTLQLKTLYT